MTHNNIKALQEERAALLKELETLSTIADVENRALTETEETRVDEIEARFDAIDKSIDTLNKVAARLAARGIEVDNEPEPTDAEERTFAGYLRGVVENRSDVNMTLTDNGAVVPKTIANKIITKIYDISPLLERSTRYNVKGELTIPYYPADSNDITMAYATEFNELESKAAKGTVITLKGYLAGVLTKVSNSLINNSQFDIVSFVVDHMAYNAARWIEGELINGTSGKVEGLSGVTTTVTAAAAAAITVDELVTLQGSVKDVFQQGCVWIMNPATRTALRKLKGTDGHFLLNDDATEGFSGTILGKPVFCSDNMPAMSTGKTAIYYGDPAGLAVKFAEEMEIQILRERFATQHATGVVAWVEMDAKVENQQAFAKLKMA